MFGILYLFVISRQSSKSLSFSKSRVWVEASIASFGTKAHKKAHKIRAKAKDNLGADTSILASFCLILSLLFIYYFLPASSMAFLAFILASISSKPAFFRSSNCALYVWIMLTPTISIS